MDSLDEIRYDSVRRRHCGTRQIDYVHWQLTLYTMFLLFSCRALSVSLHLQTQPIRMSRVEVSHELHYQGSVCTYDFSGLLVLQSTISLREWAANGQHIEGLWSGLINRV